MTLLSRVEALTGPDRLTDGVLDTFLSGNDRWDDPPLYTASVDAALAFAEKALPGWFWRAGHVPTTHWVNGRGYDNWAHVSRTNASNCDREDEATGWADSVPLAILVAVLRAKEGM